MDTTKLSREDLDARVTGELTHFAIWLEDELDRIIAGYFVRDGGREERFTELLLRREGITFQDKLEVVRAMLPLLEPIASKHDLKRLLSEVETFKSWRNALAHGHDVSPQDGGLAITVEVVTRSGKPKRVTITPESHEELSKKTHELLSELQRVRKALRHALAGA